MEITPVVSGGRQLIESYGGGGFQVSGARYRGSVLVTPERTLAWPVAAIQDLTPESLDPLLAFGALDVVLLGCGPAMTLIPADLRTAVRARGLALEPMDTGAACRTYNVLMSEQRHVAAALVAVD